jgi:serine protease Do
MKTREEQNEWMEKYLDGELSVEDMQRFEKELNIDHKLKKEFAFHQSVRTGILAVEERNNLRNRMNTWHNDAIETKNLIQRRRSGWKQFAAAASVSLIFTIGGLGVYHMYNQKQLDKVENGVRLLSRTTQKRQSPKNDALVKPKTEVKRENLGTAFAFSSDGYLFTNYHVVFGKKEVIIERQGEESISLKAKVVSSNNELDLAILKIEDKTFKGFGKIPFVVSDKNIGIAQKVYSVGYPKNDIVYAEGAVSSMSGYESDSLMYQVSLFANPGTSGSPILNEKGELIGILSAKNFDTDGETYALKTKYILDFMTKQGIKMNTKNRLTGKKLTDQVKGIVPFVFIVKE